MEKQSVECLTTLASKGLEQYATIVEERLKTNTKPITATIKRNNVVLLNVQSKRSKKSGDKVSLLKSESSLFESLYVACQTRNGDLNNFFSHENIPFPHLCLPKGSYVQGKSQTS